jgi:predicted DCC family thiol-disulfide oxidoreductase YuxK
MNSKSILYYDGLCGFCDTMVQFVLKNDPEGNFNFATLQSKRGQEALRQNGLATEDLETVLVEIDGKYFSRSQAIFEIFKKLKFPWRLMTVFSVIPTAWADGVYRWFSRNRYRFSKRKDVCGFVPPHQKERFIT